MNPHAAHPTTLAAMLRSLWGNRVLISQMSRREVLGRYKGSVMGLLWSFLNPLFMLVVYTFFFSVVFKSRWGTAPAGTEESKTLFAVLLFVGMIVHGLFAEVLNRAMGAALFHSLVSVGVLLLVFFATNGYLHWTLVFFPLILIPLVIFTVGLAWVLASLGVFVRDVGQSIGLGMTVMLFLSPVFYPVSALPESMRPWMLANPLTFIIEQARAVLIWGQQPNWSGLLIYTVVATFVAWLGYVWFQKTRKGFADVL
jgi:lipopolysaccharide transport system permease protein